MNKYRIEYQWQSKNTFNKNKWDNSSIEIYGKDKETIVEDLKKDLLVGFNLKNITVSEIENINNSSYMAINKKATSFIRNLLANLVGNKK